MGKKYYCEYCDKRFKDDLGIRRRHIEGVQHQLAKKEHFAKYKTPKSILEEESSKKPCSWFQTASCQYGQLCRFSHYTPDQLGYLQQQVNQMEYNEWLNKQPKQYSQHMIDDFMAKRNRFKQGEVTKALRTFWKHPNDLLKKVKDVPPSLQLIEPSLMPETLDTWG